MSRFLIQGQVDRLIADCLPISTLSLDVLRAGLNAIFMGGPDTPYALFEAVGYAQGKLFAEVDALEPGANLDEFCIQLEDYLEQRIKTVPAGADNTSRLWEGAISSTPGFVI